MRYRLLLLCLALLACAPQTRAQLPSDLDSSFGLHGRVTTDLGGTEQFPNSLLAMKDGRVLVSGSSVTAAGGQDVMLLRYRPNGDRDSSFGLNGLVMCSLGAGNDGATGIALDSQGRILVAAQSHDINGYTPRSYLLRFLRDGLVDSSFGQWGRLALLPGTDLLLWELRLLPDGRILLAGNQKIGNFENRVLLRTLPNGTMDNSFGLNGRVMSAADTQAFNALAVDKTTGRIYLGASISVPAGPNYRHYARITCYKANGSPDSAFGTNGVANPGYTVDYGYYRLEVDATGNLVAAGSIAQPFYTVNLINRFLPNGNLDGGFGSNGVLLWGEPYKFQSLKSLAVLADGHIVAAGNTLGTTPQTFSMGCFTAGGLPEPAFGTNGILNLAPEQSVHLTFALAQQTDGRLLVMGTSTPANFLNDVRLLRLRGFAPPAQPNHTANLQLAGLRVFPNPTRSTWQIVSATGGNYALYSTDGRKRSEGSFISGVPAAIDAALLPPGPYLLRLQRAQGDATFRLQKQ